jgi:hypothetical protein
MADTRDEWAGRKPFSEPELKRSAVTYEELARRLGEPGIAETKDQSRSRSTAALIRLGFSSRR